MVIRVLFCAHPDGVCYFIDFGFDLGMFLLKSVLVVSFGSELAIVLQKCVVVHW